MEQEDTVLDLLGWTNGAAQVPPIWSGFPARQTEAVGVSISTVHAYLTHVFGKTDTKRQSELIRPATKAVSSLPP